MLARIHTLLISACTLSLLGACGGGGSGNGSSADDLYTKYLGSWATAPACIPSTTDASAARWSKKEQYTFKDRALSGVIQYYDSANCTGTIVAVRSENSISYTIVGTGTAGDLLELGYSNYNSSVVGPYVRDVVNANTAQPAWEVRFPSSNQFLLINKPRADATRKDSATVRFSEDKKTLTVQGSDGISQTLVKIS